MPVISCDLFGGQECQNPAPLDIMPCYINRTEVTDQMWHVTVRINQPENWEKCFCLNPGLAAMPQSHQPPFKLPQHWKKNVVLQGGRIMATEMKFRQQFILSLQMFSTQNNLQVPDLDKSQLCAGLWELLIIDNL